MLSMPVRQIDRAIISDLPMNAQPFMSEENDQEKTMKLCKNVCVRKVRNC